MPPPLQPTQNRQIIGRQPVAARLEDVGQLAAVNEDRHLAGTYDQLRAVLDLVAVSGEPPHQSVAGVVEPFDDVDDFFTQTIQQSHGTSSFELTLMRRLAFDAGAGRSRTRIARILSPRKGERTGSA